MTSSGVNGTTSGTGGTASVGCPSFEPAAGSGCDPEAQVCYYANCTAPDYRDGHQLTCSRGAWAIIRIDTCEVGNCPAQGASVSQPCDAARTPGPCPGVDPCGSERALVCVEGLWKASETGEARPGGGGADGGALPDTASTGGAELPFCPASPPVFGSACCPEHSPEFCDYSDSGATSGGAAGAPFIILPDTTGGGADPIVVECAFCSEQMLWEVCEPVK